MEPIEKRDGNLEMENDPFYSEVNMRHLEKIIRDFEEGKAHFAEHELIEVDEP